MALECPYKFRLKYMDKEKTPSSATSADLVIGSAIHKALELIAKGTDPEESVDLALDEMAEARDSRPLTSSEKEEYYAYNDQIVGFAGRLAAFKQKHKVDNRTLWAERRVGMSSSFKPAGFFRDRTIFFRGVWDLAMLSKNGYMVVLDHKRRGKPVLERYTTQLKQYAITAQVLYPQIKGVASGIHFVETAHIMWAPTYTAEQIRDELRPEFVQWINDAAEAVPSNTIGIGNYCRWCDYKDLFCLKERTRRRSEAKAAGLTPNIINR